MVSRPLAPWGRKRRLRPGIWQWVATAALLLASGFSLRFLYVWGVRWDSKRRGDLAPWRIGVPVALLAAAVIVHLVYVCAFHLIGLFELPLEVISSLVFVVQVGALAWFTLVIGDRLADAFARKSDASAEKQRFDSALMRILFRLLSIIVLVFIGIYAAEYIGIPIAPLVAGLGVGGLAIALAIRPTLENIIGGLTLFADRPVRVGDFCRYGEEIGTVEEIGLRSTRIRSLERTIVTVPNAEFAQMQLDNFAARDQRLLKTVLQLRYETTPDQLRYVLAELRKMLLGHPMVTPSPARVRFVGYGASSLDLEVFAYLRCQDQDVFLAAQEDILLRMADIVSESGTGFAFPSQTVYYRRDGGLDAERAGAAETAVDEWRGQGQLPFPEFDPGLRWEMEDTLEYPPRGAYNYVPRKGLSKDADETTPTGSAPSAKPAAGTAAAKGSQVAVAGTPSPPPSGLQRLRSWCGRGRV